MELLVSTVPLFKTILLNSSTSVSTVCAPGLSVANLKIELSDLENAGILGAAGLYYDQL